MPWIDTSDIVFYYYEIDQIVPQWPTIIDDYFPYSTIWPSDISNRQ